MASYDPAISVEIIRLAEVEMEDILAFALASDARATSQSSIFSAVAAGLFAAGAGSATMAHPLIIPAITAFASAALFIVAAGISIWASKPTLFFTRGFNPKSIADAKDFAQLSQWVIDDMAKRLASNRSALAQSAKLTRAGQIIALCAAVLPPCFLLILIRCQ